MRLLGRRQIRAIERVRLAPGEVLLVQVHPAVDDETAMELAGRLNYLLGAERCLILNGLGAIKLHVVAERAP